MAWDDYLPPYFKKKKGPSYTQLQHRKSSQEQDFFTLKEDDDNDDNHNSPQRQQTPPPAPERRYLGKYKQFRPRQKDSWEGTAHDGIKNDISGNNASAIALGLAAAAVTTGQHFARIPLITAASLSKGFSASALNTAIAAGLSVAVVPFVGAVLAGYIDYYIQVRHLTKHYQDAKEQGMLTPEGDDLQPYIKKLIWNNCSQPLMCEMGAALFGAHAFVLVFDKAGLGKMLAESICNLKGSMPWQLDMVMMIASGVGMALFLTCTAIYQNKQLGRPNSGSEIFALIVVGLFAGMGAYATAMIPDLNRTHGLNMPDWGANLLSGVTCGLVVTALFSALPYIKQGGSSVAHIVAVKYENMGNIKLMMPSRHNRTDNNNDDEARQQLFSHSNL